MNESPKIVISLLCSLHNSVFFHFVCKKTMTDKMHNIFIAPKVILCMSCSQPCYYKNYILTL